MNVKREVILHIGTPKTGTTALQLAFFNCVEYLKEHGVCYPNLTESGFGWTVLRGLGSGNADLRSLITWDSDVPEERFDHIVRKAVDMCDDSDTILMSSEILNVYFARPSFWKIIAKLSQELDIQFRFVVYLRDPFKWFLACYSQAVKSNGFTADLDGFTDLFLKGKSDLSFLTQQNFVEILELAKGTESTFEIYRYEDSLPNIEDHFFENVLGLDLKSAGIASSKVNSTFNIMELEFHRGVNSVSKPLGTLFNFERSDTDLNQFIKRYDFSKSKYVLSVESHQLLESAFNQYRNTLQQVTNFAERVDYSIDTSKLTVKLDETEEKYRNQIFELGRFVAFSFASGYINWDMDKKYDARSNEIKE